MEITVGLFLVLFFLAFCCEFVDSSLGMGYGTILAPTLLIMGFEPLMVIPAVLLSQAFGGVSATIFHHQFRNVKFTRTSDDFKMVLFISGFGIIATIFAALVSINLPGIVLKTYIGVLIFVIGLIVLSNRTFNFSWKKMVGVSVLSAFNKGISGGGFGPVVTGGQILAGQKHKAAIGVTTFAEAPICLTGFMTYVIATTITGVEGPVMQMPFAGFLGRMFSDGIFQWELFTALLLGSVFVTPFGAFTTKMIDKKAMVYIVGVLITVLGVWSLYKTWF